MVRVPLWEQTVRDLPGASNVPHATPDTFGAQVGKAQEKAGAMIGHALSQLGNTLGDLQNEQDAITAKTVTSDYEAAYNTEEIRVKNETDPSQAYTIPGRMNEWHSENWPQYQQRIGGRYNSIATANVHIFHNRKQIAQTGYVEQTADKYIPLQIESAATQHYNNVRADPSQIPASVSAVNSMIEETRTSLNELQRRALKIRVAQQFYKSVEAGIADRIEANKASPDDLRAWGKVGQKQIYDLMGVGELPSFGRPASPGGAGMGYSQKRVSAIDNMPIGKVADEAAARAGIDPNTFKTVLHIESGGRNVRTGSYIGPGQLSAAEFARYGSGDIHNESDNVFATARSLADKMAKFEAQAGRPPSATELYMMHQQGEGGAAMHLANPDRPAWQNMADTGEGRQKGAAWAKKAIWGNIPDADKRRFGSVENVTSRDFVTLWQSKVEGGGTPAFSPSGAPKGPVPGMVAPGNINLANRPMVATPSGTATVRSMSFQQDGKEILVPTVARDGSRILSDAEAIAQYRDTGEHLGIFDNSTDATDYAKKLHEAQAEVVKAREGEAGSQYGVGQPLLTPEGVAYGSNVTSKDQALQDHTMMLARRYENIAKAQARQVQIAVNSVMANESPAMKWGGPKAQYPGLTNDMLIQIYGPTGAIHVDRRAADLKFNAGPAQWTTATDTAQIDSDLRAMDPRFIDPQSPAFKHWVDNFKEATQLATKLVADRDRAVAKMGDSEMKGMLDAWHSTGVVSQDQIDRAKPFLNRTELEAAYRMRDNPPKIADPVVMIEIENQITQMPPEEFQRFMLPFIAKRNLTADESAKYVERNNNFWKQGQLPPLAAAIKSLETKLSPGMAGIEGNLQRNVMDDTVTQLRAWAADNPNMAKDYNTVEAKKNELFNRARMEALKGVQFGLVRSPYFPQGFDPDPQRSDPKVLQQVMQNAKSLLFDDVDSGRVGPREAALRWQNLQDWAATMPQPEIPMPKPNPLLKEEKTGQATPGQPPVTAAPQPAPPAKPALQPSFFDKLLNR